VRFEAELSADRVTFQVSDSGIGIAPADQQVIFEMFRQGEETVPRHQGGSGLGLYIVRRFVDQLGGSVTLQSTPGMGSTFKVMLPRVHPEPRRESDDAASTSLRSRL
jgi:signal transduction histidine kinase